VSARRTSTYQSTQVLIIGAGFAGAATAWALTQRGVKDVVVLEAEAIPGKHGSGRNAAMARRVIEDPILSDLATESVARIDALADRLGRPLFEHRGGMIIGDEATIEGLHAVNASNPTLQQDMKRLNRRQAATMVPALEGMSASDAIATSQCGVVDIHGLLSTYLDEARAAGARILFRQEVVGMDVEAGVIRGVQTRDSRWRCEVLVNAGGFRADALGALAGQPSSQTQPTRRHLFVTSAWAGDATGWPFVWDVTHGLYFRPEGTGLLMCTCDETSWPAEDPSVDPMVRERLAETFSRHVPKLQGARPAQCWAGLRVLTSDGRFIIGPDPQVKGLFWVAGLGGHGMTTSASVGHVAAEGILSGTVSGPWREAFAPDRWIETR
jgi:D-arginine dehydrogenase